MKNHILPLFLAALMCAASCKPEMDQHPTGVSVSPSSASITEGETANFSATVLPADAVYSGIIWSSSDTKVASVSNGVVTGVKAGTATITATADGVSGTATVTVNAKVYPVQSVSLDKTEIELTEGDEAQLKATVAPDNATNKSVSWKSADDKVATVSSDGKVAAIAPGETTITVTTNDGNKTATCMVKINAKIYPVESVSLDKTEIELTEGDEAQLTATIAPENATNKNVTWSSSDEAIATVTAEGKVTAVKAGSATITVTTEDGSKTATCTVTVNAKVYPVESVSLDKSEIELTEGDEEQLTATIAPENATNQNVSWSSSDEEVAAVTSEGKVTAVKAGTATITVTTEDGGKTATCSVTVNAKLYPVESVSLDKATLTLTEGDNAQLTATVKPDNATNKNVTWKSSNTGVAKVSSDGKVTAVKSGTATITVTTEDGGKTATCKVTVKAKVYPVTGVTLDKATLTLTEGDNAQLTATVSPSNASNKNVSWKSSDTSVATVTSEGKVTAVKAGTATITVTTEDGSKTATCAVTVNAKIYPVESITLDKTTLFLAIGGNAQLTATIAPDNASNKNVKWSSSNTGVASVSKSGRVAAVKAGTATITVKTEDGGKTATCTVTVLKNIDGALNGVFSVSATKKIRFSKGNLQAAYVHRSGVEYVWGFATNQYDFIGNAAGNTTIDSQKIGAKVDLFCWSTAATNFGICTSTPDGDYSGDFVEWGKNIGNGSTWRTLTTDEWQYLFKTRTDALNLRKWGVTVCGKTNCVIIAPDGYTGTIADSYDASTWPEAQAAGLVCLSAAGGRTINNNVYEVGVTGNYWASSTSYASKADFVILRSDMIYSACVGGRAPGFSVRLITDVK